MSWSAVSLIVRRPATRCASEQATVQRAPAAHRGRIVGQQLFSEAPVGATTPDLLKARFVQSSERRPIGTHDHAARLDVASVGHVGRLPRPGTPGLPLAAQSRSLFELRQAEAESELVGPLA